MAIVIRKAKRSDCKRLMELIGELAVFERAPSAVTVSLEHFEESGFGETPVWWGLVAEADGLVAGFALYYIRYSTWKGQRMYLEDLLVSDAFRGKGIGQLLFTQLFEEAKQRKFNGIVWQVLEWNESAINFYKKFEGINIDAGWLNCSINF
jgi:ribosomal protein S18 acetylase RimI-like enzyme